MSLCLWRKLILDLLRYKLRWLTGEDLSLSTTLAIRLQHTLRRHKLRLPIDHHGHVLREKHHLSRLSGLTRDSRTRKKLDRLHHNLAIRALHLHIILALWLKRWLTGGGQELRLWDALSLSLRENLLAASHLALSWLHVHLIHDRLTWGSRWCGG